MQYPASVSGPPWSTILPREFLGTAPKGATRKTLRRHRTIVPHWTHVNGRALCDHSLNVFWDDRQYASAIIPAITWDSDCAGAAPVSRGLLRNTNASCSAFALCCSVLIIATSRKVAHIKVVNRYLRGYLVHHAEFWLICWRISCH